MQQIEVSAAQRTNAVILLAAIVIVSAVWQAAGLAIARIHIRARDRLGRVEGIRAQ